MKNKKTITLLYSALLCISASAQTRITRVVKPAELSYERSYKRATRVQSTTAADEMRHLTMESKQIGKTALPMVYQFKTKNLILNGGGLRELFWVDLYAAGLYLTKPTNSAYEILHDNKHMVLRLDILSNKISKKKLIKAFQQGFQKSNPEAVAILLDGKLNEFIDFLDVKVNIGDKYDIVYVPGVGTTLYVNYKNKGTIRGLQFKKALFNMWLSDMPADRSLKEELLSKS